MQPSVTIIGGGLAGITAALLAADNQFRVTLIERRRRLGGRAVDAFFDPVVGRDVEFCPHVMMGCCTEQIDFNQTLSFASQQPENRDLSGDNDIFRASGSTLWQPQRELYFFDRGAMKQGRARRSVFRPSRLLPAPLHLLPALLRLQFLSLREKLSIAQAMRRLIQVGKKPTGEYDRTDNATGTESIVEWLRLHGQTEAAIENFWNVVLVSALGEQPESASVPAAAKVFRDGFCQSRESHRVYRPKVSLARLYHDAVLPLLRQKGVDVRLGVEVQQIAETESRKEHNESSVPRFTIQCKNAEPFRSDFCIVAMPWHIVSRRLSPSLLDKTELKERLDRIHASPISVIHLWLDRPAMPEPHAVLVQRGDWLFRAEESEKLADGRDAWHHQLIISGSHNEIHRDRWELIVEALTELILYFVPSKPFELLHARAVHSPRAVISMRPGIEQLRPEQSTSVVGLLLAGDWTETDWPSTMEGAIRSGQMAFGRLLAQWTKHLHPS